MNGEKNTEKDVLAIELSLVLANIDFTPTRPSLHVPLRNCERNCKSDVDCYLSPQTAATIKLQHSHPLHVYDIFVRSNFIYQMTAAVRST